MNVPTIARITAAVLRTGDTKRP